MKKILQSLVITLLVAVFLGCIFVDICIIANVWNAESIHAIMGFLGATLIGTIVYFAIDVAVSKK